MWLKSAFDLVANTLSDILPFYKKYFKDVSREFDEFQVNTHLQAALLVLVIYFEVLYG